ncbi:hypothetical protein DF268_04710 [Streptomyces sp. V2]|uniref:ATP-binding protein n=1 Tax=Streptomyces TaxID=1883 RepID=UPI000D66E199|nr:hypothetical protein DF268_04710 [Streptomyces sp. V2]
MARSVLVGDEFDQRFSELVLIFRPPGTGNGPPFLQHGLQADTRLGISLEHPQKRLQFLRLRPKWAVRAYERAGGKNPDLCALLVSELATNAVEHAEGDRFEVTVWASLVIDVKDASPKIPEPQRPHLHEKHGRGLLLISELASEFRVFPVPDGKISTFRIDEE